MREVLEALEWVRREMMYHGSPDFIRQRELEGRVRQLAARLARRESGRQPPARRPVTTRLRPRKTKRHGKHGGPPSRAWFFTTETPSAPRYTEEIFLFLPERDFSVILGVLGVSVVVQAERARLSCGNRLA